MHASRAMAPNEALQAASDTELGFLVEHEIVPHPEPRLTRRRALVVILVGVGLVGTAFLRRSRGGGALQPASPEEAEQMQEVIPILWPPGALGSARVVQTARDVGDGPQELPALPIVEDFEWDGPILRVSLDQPDQQIVGFGGAFTDASASVFQTLSPALQDRILDMYFGEEGLKYVVGRVPINSCDFSLGSWSFDDDSGDVNLTNFDENLTHDAEAKIPFIRAAQHLIEERGEELTLFASPWSPPAWMKTNDQMTSSGTPGLRSEFAGVWAEYLSRWVTAYKQHGLPMWAMTVQNEPTAYVRWESCIYSAEQEAKFVGDHLGPTFQRDHPDVHLLSYDAQKDWVHHWVNVTLRDPRASEYLSGVAVHWYQGDYFEQLADVHRQFPDAILLASEATWESARIGALPFLGWAGRWALGEGYAHDIIGDLNSGVVAWTDWNLLLDLEGGPNHIHNFCDAALMAESAADGSEELQVHPQYHYIGHFSKYIPRGSRRLITEMLQTHYGPYQGPGRLYGTCDWSDGLHATSAMRPDGELVVVALNCGDSTIKFKLQFGARAILAEIPAHAIQTFLLRP